MNYYFVQDVLDHKYEASTGICSRYHRCCSLYRYVLSLTHFLKMILYHPIFLRTSLSLIKMFHCSFSGTESVIGT